MLIPYLLIVHSTPSFKTTKLTIETSSLAGKHVLKYANGGSKDAVVKKDFGDTVLNDLVQQLWQSAGKFETWPGDTPCLATEKFVVTFVTQHREICTSEKQFKALIHFESSASLILK